MLWGNVSKCKRKILEDFLKSDIYIVFGKGNLNTGGTVRAYLNPLVSWI